MQDILPGILDQAVSCRDVIAQEYLMEVITQVFPDDFHLRTLQPFLSATAQLHPKVNVKQIIISLIDRLAAFATREAEGEEPNETKKQREENIRRIADDRKRKLQGLPPREEGELEEEVVATEEEEAQEETQEEVVKHEEEVKEEVEKTEEQINEELEVEQEKAEIKEELKEAELPVAEEEEQKEDIQTADIEEDDQIKKDRGIPQDVELFVIFWGQIVELVKARPDLTIQDLTALLVSLINLSLSCYPEKLDYVDQILAYAKDKVLEFTDSPDFHSKVTEANLLALLLAPIQHYSSVMYLLALANYQPLLALQPYNTRQAAAHSIVNSILKNATIIDIPEDVHGILDLCDVLLRDQKDAPSTSAPTQQNSYSGMRQKPVELSYEQEEYVEKQGLLARMVHLFKSNNEDTQFLLLSAARKQFGDGGDRIRYTFPPLIVSAVKLARRYKFQEEQDEIWEKKTSALFRFIHQVISTLYHKCEVADNCLHLFLLAGQSADECGFEEIAYEFFVEAFTIYEESISESRAQFQAITCIIGALQQTRVFSADNYDTLITKAALHSSKLLKKPDQCRGVYLSSHLWWATERAVNDADLPESEKGLFRDGKRALECLQKALKIADSCMDPVTNVELFVEILNRYVYYFEKGNDAVTVKYLNGLIDLINTNLSNMDNPDQHPPTSNSSSIVEHSGPVSEYVRRHFRATLLHLQTRKEQSARTESQGPKYDELNLGDF
ncbi:unnamed protein product [Mucor hiemalis]